MTSQLVDVDPARSLDGSELRATSPTTGEVIGSFKRCTKADLDTAVEAAKAAFPAWAAMSPQARGTYLNSLARLLREHTEELASLDAMDAGLPIDAMRKDIDKAASGLSYNAGLAGEAKGMSLGTESRLLDFTVREPFGVVGRIIPFNHPASFAAGKLAAPLAAGNAVIMKPSEHTSLSAVRIGELAAEVLPAGIVSVVTGLGTEVGQALLEHPDVPRLSFIGSVETGRHVYRTAAERIKTVTLELGGKNPMIVFPDADLSDIGKQIRKGMNLPVTAGQSCGAISRLIVHESIVQEVIAKGVEALSVVKVGDPLDPATTMGPLAHRAQLDKVLRYIELGREQGAKVAIGGDRPAHLDEGLFVNPTMFTEVSPDMAVAREEIFGPVIVVIAFSTTEQAIKIANDTDFGLAASIWTRDISTAYTTARALQVGYVWINTVGDRPTGAPFGGYQLSGVGTESSIDELLSYTRQKNICASL